MSVVKINILSVPEAQGEELEARFAKRAHSVDQAPGFEGFQMLRPTAGTESYYIVTQWDSEESFQAWAAQRTHRGPNESVSKQEGLLEFEVVEFD